MLKPAQLLNLFESFECADLAVLYAARDRAAALASRAFDRDDCRQLSDLQALLRAATVIALVNELPSAVFVESGTLWRAKLTASRRLLKAELRPAEPGEPEPERPRDPFAGLTFDLFTYSVFDFQTVLLTAAALPAFSAEATRHFAAALAAASKLDVAELTAWCERTTATSLLKQLEKSGRALVASAPPITPAPESRGLTSSQTLPAWPVETEPIGTPQRVGPGTGLERDLLGLADAVRERLGYYSYAREAPFHQLVRRDPIARRCVTESDTSAILVIKPVVDALTGRPPPDPNEAPIAAAVYAAFPRQQARSGGP
jgi:hypothetical protein